MRYIALIQARCSSTRLKNKVLLPLNNKTVLECVIDGVRESNYISNIVVVTSVNSTDDLIVDLCNRIGVDVFRGSECDVLDRFYQGAKKYRPDYIVRVTADCPLYDGRLLDKAIEAIDSNTDFLGMMTDTFADGLDIEIMTFKALELAWNNAKFNYEREHVTQYIRNNPGIFNIQNFESDIDGFGDYRWTLDGPDDYEFLIELFELLDKKGIHNHDYRKIYSALSENPNLKLINAGIERNEGLKKSLLLEGIKNE